MLPLRKLITASEFCESGGTGRRARLRGVWFFHTGSSPVSRTKATALQWLFYFITAFECLSFPSRRASLRVKINRCYFIPAGMAELVDALDSGSSEFTLIQVQVLLPAPNSRNPNPKPVGEGFGFLLYIEDSPKISRIPKNSLGQ